MKMRENIKGINLKRLAQANDAKVWIEVGAVEVRVKNCLIGARPLAVSKHDVKGKVLVKDGKAASSSQYKGVRDDCS